MRRRNAMALIALALGALALAGCGGDSDEGDSGGTAEGAAERVSGPLPDKGVLLFVLRGPATVDGSTIEFDTETVDWFTDRPERRAGVAKARDLVDDWKGYDFATTPPNAALTGPGTDAVVELTKPESTSDGIAFEFDPIRGDVDEGEIGELNAFIDSTPISPYATDMHVYAQFDQGWCGAGSSGQLSNPDVLQAPDSWYKQPVSGVGPSSGDGFELFTAASVNGETSFEVQYDLSCPDGTTNGTVTFKGSVPDSLFQSNSFDCSVNGSSADLACPHQGGSGFHPKVYSQIMPKTEYQRQQRQVDDTG